MRSPHMFSVLLVLVAGCSTKPVTPQTPAGVMVDEQIAQSANTLSLAQIRLHESSAIQQSASLSGSPSTNVQSAQLNGSGGLVSSPHNPTNVKAFDAATNTQPAKVVIVEIPPSPPKPPITTKTGAGTPLPVVKPIPKPLELPWVVSPTDVTVRRVLVKWAARAGWQLVWDASVDVPVTVSASINGDFKSAVKRLFLSLSAADVNLSVLMYSGNKVLRVTESGRRAQ